MDSSQILKQLSYHLANKLTWYSLWWFEVEFLKAAEEFFTNPENEDLKEWACNFNSSEEYASEGARLTKYMWNQSQKMDGPYSFEYYSNCRARFKKLPTGFGNFLKVTDRVPTNRMKGAIRKLVIQNRVLDLWPESIKWFTDKKFMKCNKGIYFAGEHFNQCGMTWPEFMNKVDEKLDCLYATENDPRVYQFAYNDSRLETHNSSIKPYVQNRWGIFAEMNSFTEAELFLLNHFPAVLLFDKDQKEPVKVSSLLGGFNRLIKELDSWIEIGRKAEEEARKEQEENGKETGSNLL